MGITAGIDLGATRIKAGLVREGRVVATGVVNLGPDDRTEQGVLQKLEEVTRNVVRDGGFDWADVDGIGIGAPGAIRFEEGVIVKSPNFPLWKDFPLGRRLGEATRKAVRLDNDANVIALGEAIHGAGRGRGDQVCLTLGSGVGGGLVLNGDVYRGADGMAGEIGHLCVEPEGIPCNCGGRGCLEQYASATGLRNMVRRDNLFGALTEAALADPHLPERLFDAAGSGDERCQAYFREFGYRLAIGVGALLNLLNLRTVVLQGGLARALPAFGPTLRSELPTRGYRAIAEAAEIVPGELWEDGGILGAAAQFHARR